VRFFVSLAIMKVLVIQTAYIGDAILATSLLEKLHRRVPHAQIDLLVRQGNEELFEDHPYLHRLYVWRKHKQKYRHLIQMGVAIRQERYDWVFNLQRFFSSGLLTLMSMASQRVGFRKNPLSSWFTHAMPHAIGTPQQPIHEVERNCSLGEPLAGSGTYRPRLYPSPRHFAKVPTTNTPYVCIAPTSVWYTKQWPATKWVELINNLPLEWQIKLLGGPADIQACEQIKTASLHPHVHNMAGKLSLLEAAALMQRAQVNYVNDSAPLHLASAVNAPVVAIFCSTVPWFGFGPLSEKSAVVETPQSLRCRPCGLHGRRSCPEGHFRCAAIDVEALLPHAIQWASPNWPYFPNFSA